MNILHGVGGEGAGGGSAPAGDPLGIGLDERRMHVRAYNYWVSLLRGRAYPAIEDLDPANIADFGANGVLLDFSRGMHDPAIQYLGEALREECGVESSIRRISEVPSRSLLSRLTDQYLQIIANRAPIGFEAEFVGQRGDNTLYRGILMPFSSDDETIDFIYGVINWKVVADADLQAQLVAEVEAARRELPAVSVDAPAAWADGPSGGFDGVPQAEVIVPRDLLDVETGLDEALRHARESAAEASAAEQRARAAIHRALDRAYALAAAALREPEAFAVVLADARIKPQPRTPMGPLIRLVFGADHDQATLNELTAVLSHAARLNIAPEGFAAFLRNSEGDVEAIAGAERAARRLALPGK